LQIIGKLDTGEDIRRYKNSIVISFAGGRKVLSNAPVNGGIRSDLAAVFNNCCCSEGSDYAEAELKAPTYAGHNIILSSELGLDPEKTAGIITAAQMENVSTKTSVYKDIVVTAIVTGSLKTNGGRAGDPASWDELACENIVEFGTVNIMLFINVNLTDGALARALITCTEAKTAALQELLVPSRYSSGLATGSGTDSAIIVCNADSGITLADAGNHVKLGECIGQAVIASVKEALLFQQNLCPGSMHNIFERTSRFGITKQALWERFCLSEHHAELGDIEKARFDEAVSGLENDDTLVTGISLYVHLLDQLEWGLISKEEATPYAELLLKQMNMGGAGADCLVNLLFQGLVKAAARVCQ
jgi:adenosylcobinamide amidohydrolase